jgi:hypothetical protein
MSTRVRAVVAVVSHHPQVALRHRDRTELLLRFVPGEYRVRLVERPAIDYDPVLLITALHGLTADRDHPLDEVTLVRWCKADH